MTPNQYRSCLAGLIAWTIASPAAAEPRHQPVAVETRFKRDNPARIKRIKPELERRAIEALERHGIEVDETSSTTIVFQVVNVAEEEQADKAVSDYGTHIEVLVDGEKAGEKLTACMQKGEAELVSCALGGLPDVMHLIPQDEPEDTAAPAPTPEQKPSPAEKHALRWVGVALGVAGAATLITGAALRPLEDTTRSVENEVWSTDRGPRFSPRNTAVAIGVGSAALGVGIGLILTDVILTRKNRKTKTTTLSPSVSPTSAAIVLRSRF